ncbi:MAG: BadF/BadG/BcrA/BcrD ATPase family protein [bacterium]
MRCILAIDSGGSKCDALLVRDDGTVLGYGHVGADNPDKGRGPIGSGRSFKSISRAVHQAIGDNDCDELVLVGFTRTLPPINFSNLPIGCISLRCVSEQDPAFALTGEEYGVVILAGTGAVVFGTTSDGNFRHQDGLGPLLGDHGGGYQIGLNALQAVAKSHWHPRHTTTLTDIIQEQLSIEPGSRNIRQKLIDFMLSNPDRSEIARFAKFVDIAANDGDQIAIKILRKAAEDIADSTWDMVDTLGIANENLPIIGTGSVIMYSDTYWNRFCECVCEYAPNFRFMRLQQPPVLGMALKALQLMECGDKAALREKIIASASPLPAPKERVITY